jgi:hypothetical protein
LPVLAFGERLERRQRLVPHPIKVLTHRGDALWVEPIYAPSALPTGGYEANVLQDAEVLRHGRAGYRQSTSNIDYGKGTAGQALKYLPAGGVA